MNRHVQQAWGFLPPELGEFIETLPPSREVRDTWYLGTADAVYQNLPNIEAERLPYVLVLGGDHIYKVDYALMLERHRATRADVTVGVTLVTPEEASQFGIVDVAPRGRIKGFEEKPQHGNPLRSPLHPNRCCASMGIYLFSTQVLAEAVREDAKNSDSSHDFGKDVLPALCESHRVFAFEFVDQQTGEGCYWRDIGTLDAYYEAHMDLLSQNPPFDLHDRAWPMRTSHEHHPPTGFFGMEDAGASEIVDSLIAPGCVIEASRIQRSVLSTKVHVCAGSELSGSIIYPDVHVGPGSRIRRAIIEKGLRLPENFTLGLDAKEDRRAGHFVSENGVVVAHQDSEFFRPSAAQKA